MATVTQSLSHKFTVGSVSKTFSVDVIENIVKRRERVFYRRFLSPAAANIAYIATEPALSSTSLSIFDRSTSLAANRTSDQETVLVEEAKTFNINNDKFLVTDVFTADVPSIEQTPLFYRHILDEDLLPRQSDGIDDLTTASGYNVIEAKLLDSDFNEISTPELSVDKTFGIVYSNLASEFSTVSDYDVYYVQFTIDDNGEPKTFINLLDSESVFRVADLDDLDYFMNLKTDGRKAYLIEENPDGFTVTLPTVTDFAYRPENSSRIRIEPPVQATTEEPWFVSVTNGTFFSNVLGSLRKYYIAEFLSQDFDPTPTIKQVENELSVRLNNYLVKLDNKNVYESSDNSLYVSIQVNDSAGVGIAAFSTDPALEGTEADNGEDYVLWNQTDRVGIRSVDHRSGIVQIDGLVLRSTYKIRSDYYFNETEYEFKLINFNPISNKEILKTRTSLFIDPELAAETKTQTLFYLKVDRAGKVTESNWELFNNTSGLLTDGNTLYYEAIPDFLVTGVSDFGMANWIDPSGVTLFVDAYTVEGDGDFLILGDVTVGEGTSIDKLTVIDARNRGGGVLEDEVDTLLLQQNEIEWYWDLGYWDGIPYPGNASYFVEVPANVLDGAGGVLSQRQVRDVIERHTAAGVYPVAKAYGLDVVISGIDLIPSGVVISWSSGDF